MFGGGKGMGGGGGGGGGMLKVVGRAVTRAGVTNLQETISSSSNTTPTSPTALSRSTHKLNSSNNVLSLSAAPGFPFSACSTPISVNSGGPNATSWPNVGPSSGSCCDEYEWVSVTGSEEETLIGDDFVLGPVPSVDEVHNAVSALTQVFDTASHPQFITDKFAYNADKDVVNQVSSPTGTLHCVSPVGSDLDWIEPSQNLCNSRMLHLCGPERVYDAFHLLQNEPSIQRMVISLSSDRAVWNAVLNNEVVQELRETYNAGCYLLLAERNLQALCCAYTYRHFLVETSPRNELLGEESSTSPTTVSSEDETGHDSNPAIDAVKWIFENTKAKFVEAIQKITNLMNELFKIHDDEKKTDGATDPIEEKLRTSFLLSIVVLLVVVVTRAHRA